MRTFKQVSPRAYVTKGQPQYEVYAFGPGPSPYPTTPVSPPPWDGSAEGYGPARDDYQEYYNAVDPGNPRRWGERGMGGLVTGGQYAGCGSCGVGATNPWFNDEEKQRNLLIGGIVGGAVLLWLIMKKR